MIRRPPRPTRPDTRFPYQTLSRSARCGEHRLARPAKPGGNRRSRHKQLPKTCHARLLHCLNVPCTAMTQWQRISPPCRSIRARHVATKCACRPHCRCGISPRLRLCFLYAPPGAKPERTDMNRVFAFILIFAMITGIAAGWFVNSHYPTARAAEIAENLSILTDLFLRLIKMIIAPLVFATLVAGIAHMEDAAAIGRVGAKTMGWFIGASIVSLSIDRKSTRLNSSH